MMNSSRSLAGAVSSLLICFAISGCGRAEDPARVELRERLKQAASLSGEELGRLRDEVSRNIAGKTILARQGETTQALNEEQRIVVFGMLTEPIGMFDEGVREEGGLTFRVLNAPGISSNSEIEVARRLWIEVETFLPRRFQFNYAFLNPEDYSLELVVDW